MKPQIGMHIRNNLIGYLALFVALGGTAWAAGPLAGRNTVNSAALINSFCVGSLLSGFVFSPVAPL